MMKKIIFHLSGLFFLSYYSVIEAQNSFRIIVDTCVGIQRQINSVISGSSTTSLNAEADIIVNTLNPKLNSQVIEVLRINSRDQLLPSYKLYAEKHILTAFHSAAAGSLMYLMYSAQKTNEPDTTYLLISCIDLLNQKVQWTRELEGGDAYSEGHLLLAKNELVLIYQISTAQGRSESRICKYNTKGDFILKKRIGSPNSRIQYTDVAFNSNGNYYLSSVALESPYINGTYISRLDQDLNIEKSVNVKFYSTTGTYLNRGYVHLALEGLGTNIHLVTQPIIGRDGFGFVSITLFDEDLALKTWRNYSPQFRLEDFKIGTGRFLICGHQDILSGQDGISFSAINNTNAIPEINSIYKEGFKAFSIATSSGITTLGARGILSATTNYFDNKSDVISIASQSDNIINSCNESFVFTVTKDKIEVTNFDSLQTFELMDSIKMYDLGLLLEPLVAMKQVICAPVNVQDNFMGKEFFIQAQNNNYLTIGSLSGFPSITKCLFITPEGRSLRMPTVQSKAFSITIPIGQLSSGIYFVKINESQGFRFYKP